MLAASGYEEKACGCSINEGPPPVLRAGLAFQDTRAISCQNLCVGPRLPDKSGTAAIGPRHLSKMDGGTCESGSRRPSRLIPKRTAQGLGI